MLLRYHPEPTGISIYNSAAQDHWWFGTTYGSGNFHLRIGNGNDGAITEHHVEMTARQLLICFLFLVQRRISCI